MQNAVALKDWLNVIDAEYLSTFIRTGGASVKFVVTPDEQRAELSACMRTLCEERAYLLIELDACTVRAHMPQDIFFGMARQIDWRRAARRRILKLAAERSFRIDHLHPEIAGNIFNAIADVNRLDTQSVVFELRRAIQNEVSKNSHMVKDFRVAMSHICLNENDLGSAEDSDLPLIDWLTGRSTRIGNVRPFSVYTPINRTTARYFIESALYWIHEAGYTGTVILFDNSRVTVARNPKDGLRFYSRAMAMEHYQALRDFIDGADRLAHTLLVVAPSGEFLSSPNRSYEVYTALSTRVMNDVSDRNRGNPLASLVQLPSEAQYDAAN